MLEEILRIADSYEKQLPPRPPVEAPADEAIPSLIDHTLLSPEATPQQIEQICREAAEYRFASVCINPIYVPVAAKALKQTGVPVCTVVGFPLGAVPTRIKAVETSDCLESGAREIDMVLPIGLLKAGESQPVLDDIRAIVELAHSSGALVKVILEMALLSRREKILGCLLSKSAGADYVKTSTGFGPGGATITDVVIMRRVAGAALGVKAAGGIRTLDDAKAMLQAGASRCDPFC